MTPRIDKNPRTQARKDPQIYKIENKYNDLEQKIERLETHGWENNTVANSEKERKRHKKIENYTITSLYLI